MKDNFCSSLKYLRNERGIGQVFLAQQIGVGKSIISLWEKGTCEPTLSKPIALSKYFNVSLEYLAGLED